MQIVQYVFFPTFQGKYAAFFLLIYACFIFWQKSKEKANYGLFIYYACARMSHVMHCVAFIISALREHDSSKCSPMCVCVTFYLPW